MEAATPNHSNVDHMADIPAENGVDNLDRLAAVRDCHIDENRTLALSHERGEVGASTPNRSNGVRMVSIPTENGVEI